MRNSDDTGNVWSPFVLRFNTQEKSVCAILCRLRSENILVLDIFFEALNYEKIEQKKAYEIAGLLGKITTMTLQKISTNKATTFLLLLKWQSDLTHCCQYVFISLLLGDIGGQMGLFIGASVLTILEIFDYLYEVKFCLFKELKFYILNDNYYVKIFILNPFLKLYNSP